VKIRLSHFSSLRALPTFSQMILNSRSCILGTVNIRFAEILSGTRDTVFAKC